MIKKQVLLSFILIIILILIINFNRIDKFTIFETNKERIKQDYVGPIIFLQRNNENKSEINCLNKDSQYKCIGKYPREKLYPTAEELKYLSEPNIIRIPRGNIGPEGELGLAGINSTSSWIPTSNVYKIVSNKYNNNLNFKSTNINFNSSKNTIKEFNKLCIIKDNELDKDYCINRNQIMQIIDSFNPVL
tara:strand:+ start:1042 stop:1611 length:570 start_codon:yes stop_codon:yes gene_type:complete